MGIHVVIQPLAGYGLRSCRPRPGCASLLQGARGPPSSCRCHSLFKPRRPEKQVAGPGWPVDGLDGCRNLVSARQRSGTEEAGLLLTWSLSPDWAARQPDFR